MNLIHSFWFVAFAVADRMAISPLPPICSAISLVWISATSLATTWLMKTSRQSGLASESNATILAPAVRASPRAVQTASGSFAAITMTLVPAWVSALMKETWLDAEASSGPTTWEEAKPAAVAPFFAAAQDNVGVRVVELLGDEGDLQVARPRRACCRRRIRAAVAGGQG